jgi:serine/threonine protein kinase
MWYLIDSLLGVLAHLENLNIFHGDIRPVNISLSEEGHVKIADHGLLNNYKTNLNKFISNGERLFLSPE